MSFSLNLRVFNIWLFVIVLMWIYGVVLAKGFWSTVFAIWTPWSLYLAVEKIASIFNLL